MIKYRPELAAVPILPSLSALSNPPKNPSRYLYNIGVKYASAVADTPRGTV
jgi:hypothetical protein